MPLWTPKNKKKEKHRKTTETYININILSNISCNGFHVTNPAQSIACSSVLIIYSTASQLVAWIALAGALGFYDHKRAKGKDSRIPDIRVVDCELQCLE